MATEIWISGNVPSKKNSKIIVGGKPVNSPTIARWQKISYRDWENNRILFRELTKGICPIFVHLTFVRDRDNLWDFTAPTETIADEMVKWGWLNDDNIYEFVPCFGRPRLDRARPGTIIKVLKSPPKYDFL